jgi:hypothetical protein
MPDDVQSAIQQNVQGPSSALGDSGEVSQHAPESQIAADKFLGANQALKKNHGGVRMVKLQASGTVL